MFARFSYPVDIHRRKKTTWGGTKEKNPNADVPVLFGTPYSHTIENCVIAPRATEDSKKHPHNAMATITGMTLFCEPDADIESEDLVVYTDYTGKKQVWAVEGETAGNFISPFTNTIGGKEIYLTRPRNRRA